MNTAITATTAATAPRAAAISALGLRKSYGDKVVLDGIDLRIPVGTVFALLGPNGAGKTTAVEILSTLITADSGEAHVGGHDVAADADSVRRQIGVTGQFAAVDGLLTAEENLLLMADLYHLSRSEGRRRSAELLERFELTEAAHTNVATFSGGMRRKLDLAMTLVGRPRILFLDEPTTGLDPRSRRVMWELIRNLVTDQGVTIFLTTQYLEEADHLADRIAVLDHGKLVAEGTAQELKRLIPGGHVRVQFTDEAHLATAAALFGVAALPPALGSDRAGGTSVDESLVLRIASDGSLANLRAVLDVLDSTGVQAESLTVHTPDLDDVFLTLTGRQNAATVPAPQKESNR